MKPALVPAVFASTVGVLCVFIFTSFVLLSSIPMPDWKPVLFLALLFYLLAEVVGMAVVVFPTCLFVVMPLLRFVPRSSPLWQPACAAAVGAVVGPIAAYLWLAALRRQFYVPNPHDSVEVLFMVAPVLVGITFGYCYAGSVRTVRA